MKNFSILMLILIAATSTYATVHTVSNNAYSPGQFTNLQNAIDSANAGDSIYVEPSATDYGGITINKKLYLFGGGGDPQTYQFNNPTTVDGVTYANHSSFPFSSPSGSVIQGFALFQVNVGGGLSNITVARNSITYNVNITSPDTNMVIVNNTFSQYNGQSVYFYTSSPNDFTALISNNFFYNAQVDAPGEQENGIIVENNIFYGNSSNASNSNAFFNSSNAIIVKNNIFYCDGGNNAAFTSGCTGCSFLDNITYSPNTTQTLPDAGNTGSGNINNTNPQFINGPAAYTTIATNNTTLYQYNWALSAGSPGHLAGTDGSDIGIFGGAYPMPGFETLTKLPQVRQVNISNTSVGPNGTLNVNVIGTKHN